MLTTHETSPMMKNRLNVAILRPQATTCHLAQWHAMISFTKGDASHATVKVSELDSRLAEVT